MVYTSEDKVKEFYLKAKSMTLTEILEAKKTLTWDEQGRFMILLAKAMGIKLKFLVQTDVSWKYDIDIKER